MTLENVLYIKIMSQNRTSCFTNFESNKLTENTKHFLIIWIAKTYHIIILEYQYIYLYTY